MVEVVHFPKRCPHCGSVLASIRKMYCRWMECQNKVCPYLTTPRPSIYVGETTCGDPFKFARSSG